MSIPLLTTKLYVPPVQPGLVLRSRLIERLDAGLGQRSEMSFTRKLTLVAAPAGFGKTTLLSDWAHRCDCPVAWLSLDDGDNDLARFLNYVVAALKSVDVDLDDDLLGALQMPQGPPIELFVTRLLNQMNEASMPVVLVLDDYHLIATKVIHDALTSMLDHLPPNLHLVIASRTDPPLPLARLRGRGLLTEIRQVDLRFTAEEAAEFLNRAMGLDLSVEDVAALEKRTEGWIAGLQMAAVSMRGRKDVSGFIKTFSGSHRFILDYLVEEVLERQRGDVQGFLVKTSILERMTAPLCDLITDRDDSQSILESLEAANLFLVPLDDERRWYRYHRLFADLLRQRLHRERPGLSVELHRRASRWYEEDGLVEEAVSHALAASDYEQAASLLEPSGWEMVTRGACTTLLGWLDAFPDTFLRSRPQLHVSRAWCLVVTGQGGIAESSLADIEHEHVQGEIAAVRAYAASVRGDPRQGIEFARRALEQLPEDNLALRGFLALNLGIAHSSSGEPAAASRVLNQAIELSRATAFTDLTLAAMGVLGHVQHNQARLHQGIETHRDVLDLARQLGDLQAPVIGIAHLGIAEVLYEWNELGEAVDYVAEGIRLLERGRFITYLLFGYSLRAQARHAHGDLNGAQIVLQQAERLAEGSDFPYMTAVLGGLRARLNLARGNAEAAARWAGEHRWIPDDEFDHAREVEQIAVARMLIVQDRPSEALSLLERLLEAARAAGRMWNAIRILALQALAFADHDNLDSALAALDQTLVLAEPEGFVRTFVDEGESMARLLRRALSEGVAPDYVARLLAAFAEEVELTSPVMGSLVEPLTERELQVLRLIVAGLSNPEIAEELFIAVSTVKSHVNHIYGKLGVSNRVEAVTRAQALALL